MKNRIRRLHLQLTVFVLLLCLLLPGCFGGPGSGPAAGETEAIASLHIKTLKIGKTDASILYLEGSSQAVLIDTGEEEDGPEIVENLNALGITEISHMIVSHFDKDHMGGAAYILEQIPVKEVIQPTYEKDGKKYETYRQSLNLAGQVTSVTEPVEFTADGLSFAVYPENDTENQYFPADEDNDRSLVVMVSHGQQRLLFTGDIKEDRIQLLLESDIDLSCGWIKMPHHGSYNDELAALLEAADPQYAVICCSDKNPADKETLLLLAQMGISCWLTADGDITFTSDGENMYGIQ